MSRGTMSTNPFVSTRKDIEDPEDITDIFGDIDWSTANLTQLEQQWRQELAAIEEENVKALMEGGGQSERVLPYLQKAIDEVGNVEGLLDDYCERLKVMGHEIQQIEQINRALNCQTSNQRKLLEEVDEIIKALHVPESVLSCLDSAKLEDPNNVKAILSAAQGLSFILNTPFEDGLGSMRAVRDRLKQLSSHQENFIDRLSAFFTISFDAYVMASCVLLDYFRKIVSWT